MAEQMQMQPPAQPPQAPQAPQGQLSQPDMEQLQRVRQAVMKVLYGDQTWQQIPAMIKRAPNPAAGIAAVTMFVLDLFMKESKGNMPPEMKQAAVYMLLSELSEIAGPKGMGMKVGPDTINEAKALIVKQMQGQQPAQQSQPPARPPGIIAQATGAQ